MLSKKLEAALNHQLNHEFETAFYYLAMSAYFRALNLNGFAAYARAQAEEEMSHGMMLNDYINQRSGRVVLTGMSDPPKSWKSPAAAIEDALRREVQTGELINSLVSLALSEKDHATNMSLLPLVTEQVEDEASAHDVVERMKLVAKAPDGLYLMDRDLEQRAAAKATK
jgi:ferritin